VEGNQISIYRGPCKKNNGLGFVRYESRRKNRGNNCQSRPSDEVGQSVKSHVVGEPERLAKTKFAKGETRSAKHLRSRNALNSAGEPGKRGPTAPLPPHGEPRAITQRWQKNLSRPTVFRPLISKKKVVIVIKGPYSACSIPRATKGDLWTKRGVEGGPLHI